MGKKRKQDPGRDDSISSDTKRKRCRSCYCQNGETSRPVDGMPPWEGLADTLRDAIINLTDAIQVRAEWVRASTEEKFKRKIQKLKEKRKKDKTKHEAKHEEDLRLLKEDLIRILKEDHQELKLQIQKEGCGQVYHYKASPSQRSQLSQSTRFRLVIENNVSRTIYKKETVKTEDGGGHIKVVMYDGGNPIASDHRLASVRVELVVIEGEFDEKRDSWSKEEFEESIIKPRRTTTLTSLVKNGTFNLIGGSCDHEGAIIMDNSQQREVKLGVRITLPTETRVLEGVSNPFKVQEGKTKKLASTKKGNKPSPPVRTRNVLQPINTQATQHDRGEHTEFLTDGTAEDNRPATVTLMDKGNGQALNGNCQQSCEQIPMQISWPPTSNHSMQHGQNYGLPSTSNQNLMQATGYGLLDHPSLACGQDQYASFSNFSADPSFDDVFQRTSNPTELGLTSQSIGEISDEDIFTLNFQTQTHETYGPFICGRVLLQWDEPHVELKKHWNFLDQLMPLYSTQSGFYRESFPSTSLMEKARKLMGSTSGDSVMKIITSLPSRATQTPQRRGVLIRPIEPYDSDDQCVRQSKAFSLFLEEIFVTSTGIRQGHIGQWSITTTILLTVINVPNIFRPPVKKQRNAKYQLRFVNRVCNDYYTREQIKSEDGNLLKVALYDENNLVVTSGPLSSACVEVVLLHGDFNAEGHDYWTSEEFSTCLVYPQSVKEAPALGGDRVLTLIDGEADLGNVNFQTSSFHARTGKFIIGVEIKNVREESVQEGITSPFLVRVRQGEESSCHQTTSFKLLGVRIQSAEQVCGELECDARENVGPSSTLEAKDNLALVKRPQLFYSQKKRPQLRWTADLHERFVDAVMHLGIKRAVPEAIRQVMNVEGLTRQHVASHLQKFRLFCKRNDLYDKGPLCPSDHSIREPTPVPHSLREPTPVPHSLRECQDSESLHLKTKEIDTSSEDFAGDLMKMYKCFKDSVGDLTEMSTFSEASSDLTEIDTFSDDEPGERKINGPERHRPSLFNIQSQYS